MANLLEKGVAVGIDVVGDEHGDDEPVNSDDTRHDDGDDGLHDQLGSHHRHRRDARPRLGRAVGSSKCYLVVKM